MEQLKQEQLMIACHNNNPITSAEIFAEMVGEKKANYYKQLRITDEDWMGFIRLNWWYHNNNLAPQMPCGRIFDKRLFELRDKLLSFGGSEVCLPTTEPDLENILEYGQIWYSSVKMCPGLPSSCHSNSAKIWMANKSHSGELRICTGYALSEDGMWRSHSWLVCKEMQNTYVVETTIKRVLYFGVAMTKPECEKFCLKFM